MTTIRRAPTTVLIIAATVTVVAVIAALTAITIAGRDPAALQQTVTILMDAITLVLGGGALTYAASGARAARSADERLNGGLDERIRAAVRDALVEMSPPEVGSGGDQAESR